MELRQLRYLIEVAERQHVTEAADHLNVAQSAVSYQITKLEEELGVKLLERVGRNIKITPIGKIFLQFAISALKTLDEGKEKVEEYLNPLGGTLHIGYPSSLSIYWLPNLISAYKEVAPNVNFRLRHGSYAYLIDAVKKGEIDLAFLGPVPMKEPDLEAKILFMENIVALIPERHPLADKRSLNLSDLRTDPFVLFPDGYVLRKIAVDACHEAGFEPNIVSEGEDMDALKGLVSAGIGVSLLPESTFYDSVPRFTVKVPIEAPKAMRSVGIIIPKHRDIGPSEKNFYQFLIQFFNRLDQYK
ncbi:LysR family transcriptional activator of glutamate synthase operon [Neobacillus niacini]|uniref:LysR family transcriptional regulator n=1 Tax=Neobacillus driksii TaxID=3035913 RepID=UPI00278B0FBF|nr:LysR family transcriptional regulator [Neobacillus niacini]MDQ0972322.1 LysR family transcriptional activator of glutamate synthase operon [Neobacillus niacini]